MKWFLLLIVSVGLNLIPSASHAQKNDLEGILIDKAVREKAAVAELDRHWDNKLPLPRFLLQSGWECRESRDGNSQILTAVSAASKASIEYFIGLCALNAGLKEKAALHFEKAANFTKEYTNGLISDLQIRATIADLDKDDKKLSSDLYGFMGKALDIGRNFMSSGSSSRQMAKTFDDFLKLQQRSIASDITELDRQIKSMRNEQKGKELQSTYRVPLVAQGGYLSHIVKVFHGGGSCTGSFVGPNIVLTNFHCVGPVMEVRRITAAHVESYKVLRYLTPKGYDAPHNKADSFDNNNDWAFLILDRAKPDPENYLLVIDKPMVPDSRLMVAGYAGDVSAGQYITSDVDCPVTSVNNEARRFTTRCSGSGGQSGSPVLSIRDQRYIVGVFSHADWKKSSGPATEEDRERTRMNRVFGSGPTAKSFIGAYQELMKSMGYRYTPENTVDAPELLATFSKQKLENLKTDNFKNMQAW